MNATYVNLIASQEVTGGIILGIIFLSEIPGPGALAGVVITLVGIAIVLL
jgi:drug/metabolite transporter (DMT)-like permease